MNTEGLIVQTTPTGVCFDVRVMPRAPKVAVGGVREGRLIVRVTAAPVDNAANEAVVAALADALHVPRRSIRIVSGHTSRNKRVEVGGRVCFPQN